MYNDKAEFNDILCNFFPALLTYTKTILNKYRLNIAVLVGYWEQELIIVIPKMIKIIQNIFN